VATSRDDIDLLGLDHPFVQELLGTWRSLPPEELGVAVKDTSGQAAVLTFWMVESLVKSGERRALVLPLAVNADGKRVPTLERSSQSAFESPPAEPEGSVDMRRTFISRYIEPTLQRELRHKGLADGDGSYSAELIGYVEIAA
jgi:hypothetical protein